MYHGAYEGATAAAQPKRSLILGESHHGNGPEDVVSDYLSEKDGTAEKLMDRNKNPEDASIAG